MERMEDDRKQMTTQFLYCIVRRCSARLWSFAMTKPMRPTRKQTRRAKILFQSAYNQYYRSARSPLKSLHVFGRPHLRLHRLEMNFTTKSVGNEGQRDVRPLSRVHVYTVRTKTALLVLRGELLPNVKPTCAEKICSSLQEVDQEDR